MHKQIIPKKATQILILALPQFSSLFRNAITKQKLIVILTLFSIVHATQNAAAQDATDKNITRISSFQITENSSGINTNSIAYSYNLSTHKDIYIQDLGTMPSQESYVIAKSWINNLDLKLDNKISFIAIEGSRDYPSEEDFRSYGKTFSQDVYEVKYLYPSVQEALKDKGFNPMFTTESEHDVIITDFIDLGDLPDYLMGQIALRISYPHTNSQDVLEFKIEYITREQRIKSGTWRFKASENPDIVDISAKKYLAEFRINLLDKL